ncbi:hypothetical protein LEP1GSC199_0596 [Leptospira vanthielii serovar Holland str. Waz Holland = ATCC 700522]|uniref:Uncharacterized protein n=2 Tax=Leptospira vanthielii TaxID=293085 RepID=N1W6P0_9LEPT|nr:hypothetical protein LEP1GSC199_0596 [Leptospira vanthielii serovar Holland str. Waz Holland = ATCC 700522]
MLSDSTEIGLLVTNLVCFNELAVQLGAIPARNLITKFNISIIDSVPNKIKFPTTEIIKKIFESDDKTEKIQNVFRTQNEALISKAFSILIQILYFTLAYSAGVTEIDEENESELDSKNFFYLMDMIQNLIPKFSEEITSAYFCPDNDKRIKFVNDSFENLTNAYYIFINYFIKCVSDQLDLADYLKNFQNANHNDGENHYPKKAINYIKKNQLDIINFLTSRMEDPSYLLPYRYKVELILDYYITGRKIKINDIADSLLLIYIPEHYILTFDKKLLKFIKQFNEENFKFCMDLKKLTYGA